MVTTVKADRWEPYLLPYATSEQTYTGVKNVQWAEYLNAFSIHNTGNTIVVFRGDPIPPGASKSIGGNRGEVYTGRLDIMFQLPSPAPPTPINSCVVTQKYYQIEKGR